MAASAWLVHDNAKKYILDGDIDLTNDVIICSLFLTTSNVHQTSVDLLANATLPETTQNGYAPFTVTGKDVSVLTTTTTFNCNDVVWTAATTSITGAYAALWDDTATIVVNPIICSSDLNSGANIVATVTNTFTIEMNASGVFTLS